MTDTIRLDEDQLQKIMAAILTAGGKYDHEKQVVDEVKRLCDEVDGSVSREVKAYARVGGHVKFLHGHWATVFKKVSPGDILMIERIDEENDFWTESVKGFPAGICIRSGDGCLEFLP